MKRILSFIFLLSLLVLLWPNDPKPKKINKPNTINQQQTPVEVSEKPVQTEPPKKSKKTFPETDNLDFKINLKPADKPFSYLQLYRDFRFLSTCYRPKTKSHSVKSASNAKQNKQQHREVTVLEKTQSSASYLNQYAVYSDRCDTLHEKYPDTDLTEALLTAPTETEKEQQIQALRRMIQPWYEAWQHLFNAAKGIISPEALVIKAQLDEIETQWKQQFKGAEFTFTDAERNTYFETKKELEAQLNQLITKDPKTKEHAWQQVQNLSNEIKAYMYLQDADLFYEASLLLGERNEWRFFNGSNSGRNFKSENLDRLSIPYQFVSEEVGELTGILNSVNFQAIAPYANQLYLCGTGADCEPGSIIMNHYCFNPEHRAACDKDLLTFFADDYLGPNQFEDVLNLYEYLVVIYAP